MILTFILKSKVANNFTCYELSFSCEQLNTRTLHYLTLHNLTLHNLNLHNLTSFCMSLSESENSNIHQ